MADDPAIAGAIVTKYAIQHRTSKRWIACPPSTCAVQETTKEAEAHAFDFASIAEVERLFLAPFADAYQITLVTRRTE